MIRIKKITPSELSSHTLIILLAAQAAIED